MEAQQFDQVIDKPNNKKGEPVADKACKHCGVVGQVYRYGSKRGKQCYRCVACKRLFTGEFLARFLDRPETSPEKADLYHQLDSMRWVLMNKRDRGPLDKESRRWLKTSKGDFWRTKMQLEEKFAAKDKQSHTVDLGSERVYELIGQLLGEANAQEG